MLKMFIFSLVLFLPFPKEKSVLELSLETGVEIIDDASLAEVGGGSDVNTF